MAIQDRVFLDRAGSTDPYYAAARERLLIIAVECEHPASTCFCTSTRTGPAIQTDRMPLLASKHAEASRQAEGGNSARLPLPMLAASSPTSSTESKWSPCDLVLTEIDHAFVVRPETPAGHDLVKCLHLEQASNEDAAEGQQRVTKAAQSMKRTIDLQGVRGLLHANQEHPRWDNVASRCIACANCTMVCPTCFCSATEDSTDLSGDVAERSRRWDSCFNPDFASVHGGNFRTSIRARYRQWLTHKFASWFDQFDSSGCVGCGRCIAWCPAGIDILEEIAAIRGEKINGNAIDD
ncbi:MAG: 4Fe-4S dicluster domain-containing protein [Planctomycetes bacterium]|nr:4Fe-4S dicluster domain-containing protein [Planctomycetota bacterium]